MRNILIDIETMGRNAGCVVMSVAAVAFNRDFDNLEQLQILAEKPTGNEFIQDSFYEHLDVTEQLLKGYRVEPWTQKWWTQQSEEAKKEQIGNAIPLKFFCMRLQSFLNINSDEDGVIVWAQGTDFDISILRKMFYDVMGPDTEPWKHWNIRDSRTYILEVGKLVMNDPYKEIPTLTGEKHSALVDAKQSAFNVTYVTSLMKERIKNS